MGNFNSAVLTKKGNELLTTAVAGRKIIFTRLVTGSGVYTEEEKARAALEKKTVLKQQKQEFTFSSYEKVSQTSVLLTALITNRELKESYKMTEVGIYGKEVDAEEDFLCSISVTASLEESDTFPAFNGLRESQIIQDYYITISVTAEVTVEMTGAPALAEDLEKLKIEFESTNKVIVGPENTEIGNNTILFVTRENIVQFKEARITNLIISSESPQDKNAENWGKSEEGPVTWVQGRLTVNSQPKEDTKFWGKVKEE